MSFNCAGERGLIKSDKAVATNKKSLVPYDHFHVIRCANGKAA
jgi:hypothetical protein